MIRRPGIVSRFRMVGVRAEVGYRGSTRVEFLYPPLALIERRTLDDGLTAVAVETSNGTRSFLVGPETIAEVAALPTSTIDPTVGVQQLDQLVRDHLYVEQPAGAPPVAEEARPATLVTDGTFITLTAAGERHHFMLSSGELPSVVGAERIDDGQMWLSLRLPNRTVVALRVAADGVIDAEKSLVALRSVARPLAAPTAASAASARPAPPRRTYQSREHPDGTSVLVLGILSLVVCGLLGPIAWSKGNSALKEMERSTGVQWTNRGNITAGRVCGIISSVLLIVWVLAILVIIGSQ